MTRKLLSRAKEKKGANSKLLTMKSSDMRSNRLGRTEWRFWHDSAASVQKTMPVLGSLPVEQSLFGSLASGAKLVSYRLWMDTIVTV